MSPGRQEEETFVFQQITFVMTCMGRLAHLQKSLPRLVEQRAGSIVIVDYSCPQNTAAWVESTYEEDSHVVVVRVEGEKTFSPSRARNRGAAAVETPWIFFLDADILLDGKVWFDLLAHGLNAACSWRGLPYKEGLSGGLLVSRAAFDLVGGYDERYQGWGFEDEDICQALAAAGILLQTFPDGLLEALQHDDRLRTQYYDTKKMWASALCNGLYMATKWSTCFLPMSTGAHTLEPEILDLLYRNAARVRDELLQLKMMRARIGRMRERRLIDLGLLEKSSGQKPRP
jgi:glycosyltransferase involved in cell wall biosynthesis